jgi:hypothetical protein
MADVREQHPKRIENRDQKFISVGDKDLKKLQRKAWDAGWWPAAKKSGILWQAPDKIGQAMVHATANGPRAFNNIRGIFREAGLDV